MRMPGKALKQSRHAAACDTRHTSNAAIHQSAECTGAVSMGGVPPTRWPDDLRMNGFYQVCGPERGIGGQLCRTSEMLQSV